MKNKTKKMLSLGVFALTISSGSYACNHHDDISSPEDSDTPHNEMALVVHDEESSAGEDQLLNGLLLSPQSSFDQPFQNIESDEDPYEELSRTLERFIRSVDEFIPYYPGNGTRVSVMANYLPYYIYETVYDDVLSFSIPSFALDDILKIILKSQGTLPNLTEHEMSSPKALALYVFRNWQTIFEFLDDMTEEIANINFDVSMMNDDEPILPVEEGEDCWKSERWINNTDHIIDPCLMDYLPRYISELIYTEFLDVTLENARGLNAARHSFAELTQALCGILDECIATSRLDQDDLLARFEQSGVRDISHDDVDYIINDNIIPLPDLSEIELSDQDALARYFVRNWATLYLMIRIMRPGIRGMIQSDHND